MDDVQAAEAVMRAVLEAAGFDFDHPDPSVAWTAFRDFVTRPLPGLATASVGVEFYNADDRDEVLWLEFARLLYRPDGGEWDGGGWHCGCLMCLSVPEGLVGVSQALWWWAEHGTLAERAANAERLPAFSICMALEGWRWEGGGA